MDLIIVILFIVAWSVLRKPGEITKFEEIRNPEGEVIDIAALQVGKNLYLNKEERAYHKILDEFNLV